MDNKAYIENNDEKTALKRFLDSTARVCGRETVEVGKSYGRVTAEAVFARFCDPVYNAAAMDGIAVTADNTLTASEDKPLTLIRGKDFDYVNTGNPVEGAYDAVIMIENVIAVNDNEVRIIAPAYPLQHVRVIGESIVAGELVLPSKHLIRAVDVGALIAAGLTTVEVFKKPRVGIIPTGGEMTRNPLELKKGKLMESNSAVFAALTEENGGVPVIFPICPDRKEDLKQAVCTALEQCDAVLVNAGSSAGTKDYTVKILAELGEILVHGIAIKPGKPTILAKLQGKPVLGIPGYPVSAYLVFDAFAKPLLQVMSGRSNSSDITVKATLTRRIAGSFKHTELIRMSLGSVGGKLVATPLERGAAAVMSMVKADGIFRLERLVEGAEAGETVDVKLVKPYDDILKALVIVGSHDMIIDVLADKIPLTSAHVGSTGGIVALQRGECHLAPIHLLDENGEYNVSVARKHFPPSTMALIRGVGRIQGIIVPKGNPKNITDISAFFKSGLMFANRQRGAGTRVLFDHLLAKSGMSGADIRGYEKEYGTHLSVAVAVKNGVADGGLGVLSAANALELDFIPVGTESYDFLIPRINLEDLRVKRFIEVLRSEAFKDKLNELGGYTCENIGETVLID